MALQDGQQAKAMTPRLALEIVGVSAWDSGAHGADWCNQCHPHGQTNLAAHAQTNLTISYDFYPFSCLHMFRVFFEQLAFVHVFFSEVLEVALKKLGLPGNC